MELVVSKQSGAGERDPSEKKGRVRTCVGCGEQVDVGDVHGVLSLVRLILGPGGVVAVDPGDGGFGRGAHVHPRRDCLGGAVSRGLARAAKGRVHAIHVDSEANDAPGVADGGAEGIAPLTAVSLARAIRQAMDRRIQGLVRTAVRSHRSAIGADAVRGACGRGEAALVLVACDAAAGAELPEIRRAVTEGRAVAWGTKQGLGSLSSGPRKDGVAVLAITSPSLAAAVSWAVHTADACASIERGERGDGADAGGRGAPGRRARRHPKTDGRTDLRENPEGVTAKPALPGSSPPRVPGEPTGKVGGAGQASGTPGNENEEDEGAAACREEQEGLTGRRGGAGRLLATAPAIGNSGAVGSIESSRGTTGRAPTVDRFAANRRPRGWVRRIG